MSTRKLQYMNAPFHAFAARTAIYALAAVGFAVPLAFASSDALAEWSGPAEVLPGKASGLRKSATTSKVRPACKPSKSALGVSRTITIDATGGPKYGFVNYPGKELLKDKEVLLTFDDGPLPRYTNKVLEALEKECTRATFFVVGRMAMAFPKTVKRIMNEGHTVGTHTWSHGNLQRHNTLAAMAQIDRGVAATEAAAGRKIAPLFRFPYLGRTNSMESHLSKRNLAVFSIDIDSRDTRGYSPSRMISHTIARLKSRGKGIVLFHDIKRTTAAATAPFLRALRKNGFKIVHLKASNYSAPVASLKSRYEAILDKRANKNKKKNAKAAPTRVSALPIRNKRLKALRAVAKPIKKPVTKTQPVSATIKLPKAKPGPAKRSKIPAKKAKSSKVKPVKTVAKTTNAGNSSGDKPIAITPQDPFADKQ